MADLAAVMVAFWTQAKKELALQERGIKYGFTIAAAELPNTIATLWKATQSFMATHPQLLVKDNLLSFVTGTFSCIRISVASWQLLHAELL